MNDEMKEGNAMVGSNGLTNEPTQSCGQVQIHQSTGKSK